MISLVELEKIRETMKESLILRNENKDVKTNGDSKVRAHVLC